MRPFLRASDGIVLPVFGLLCIGVVMVNSAGLTIDTTEAVTFRSILWSRPTLYMLLAMACLLIAARAPLGPALARIAERAPLVVILVLLALMYGAMLLCYAPVIGHASNGSHRWIMIPGLGITMQPSELVKWLLPFVLAIYCALRRDSMTTFSRGLGPGLVIVGPLAALVAIEDLGTGVLILAAACLVFVASGARIWHFVALAPLGLVALVAAILASPYRVHRLIAFLDPYSDPDGTGYHMIQSLVAVANGRIFGRGLGFGLQKFGYLPEDRTDFLFAVICEELGVAGALLVLALIATIIWGGATIVRRQSNDLLRLFGLGIVATFSLQALINLAVVTGLAPSKGIALPLLSSGGTGWVLTAGSLGLLVAMDRQARRRGTAGAEDTEVSEDARARPLPAAA